MTIAHRGTQEIRTARLRLRRIVPDDADMVYAWMSDPEVYRYERWKPHPSVEYTRGYIIEVFDAYKSNRLYHWGVESNGALIGSVCVVDINDYDQKAILGYCLARKFWSNGYATEAAKSILNYMFCDIGLNRMEASHSVNNIASGKVLKKCGMIVEGQASEYYFSNSGVQDSILYGITKKQYLYQG